MENKMKNDLQNKVEKTADELADKQADDDEVRHGEELKSLLALAPARPCSSCCTSLYGSSR